MLDNCLINRSCTATRASLTPIRIRESCMLGRAGARKRRRGYQERGLRMKSDVGPSEEYVGAAPARVNILGDTRCDFN